MSKTVPLSVRVSDEDAAFLAGLDIADAKTPSEKLRAILARERQRAEGTQDPDVAVDLVQDMLRPAQRSLRRQEGDGRRSDLVHSAYSRIPDIVGLLLAGPRQGKADNNAKSLVEFEMRLAAILAAIARDFMELGLSSRERCYHDEVLSQHIPSLVDLADLIKLTTERRKERT